MLKRLNMRADTHAAYDLGGVRFYVKERCLLRTSTIDLAAVRIDLTDSETKLLLALLRNKNQAVHRTRLQRVVSKRSAVPG